MSQLDDVLQLVEPGKEEGPPAVAEEKPGQQTQPAQPPTQTPAAPAPATPAASPEADYVRRGEMVQLINAMTQLAAQQRPQAVPDQPVQRWAPEVPSDPEALLLNGNALVEHYNRQLQGMYNDLAGKTGSAMYYQEGKIQELERKLAALNSGAAVSARDRAKAEVEKMGFSDFDELAPKVAERLRPYAGADSNPDAWKQAFLMARLEEGRPWFQEPKSTPPVSLPARGSTHGEHAPDLSKYQGIAAEVQREFNLTSPLKFTAEEIEALEREVN